MAAESISQLLALARQHRQAGRLAEAEACYRRILSAQPRNGEAWHGLGLVAFRIGRLDLAGEWILQASLLSPNDPATHSNLGEVHRQMSRLTEAVESFQCALRLNPNLAETYNNLGLALAEKGLPGEAMTAYRRALLLRPDYPEAHLNIGNALSEEGRIDEALTSFRRALDLRPDFALAHCNAGAALAEWYRFDEAVAALQQALALEPQAAEAWNYLGDAWRGQGRYEEAVAAYRRAVELQPGHAGFHSSLIQALVCHPAQDTGMLAEEWGRWNQQFSAPWNRAQISHANERSAERRLRIGYVSPNLWSNAISFFLRPLLAAHDREACEIYCYDDGKRRDATTWQLRQQVDVWREARSLSDAQFAECVLRDGIDILVDLSMHTNGNRLASFARKPAPIQVSWLAYPGSTGVDAMDCRLTDARIDPPSGDEDETGGRAVRLPDCWCCYAPAEEFPAVGPLPAEHHGKVTFGAFNFFWKVHEALLHCWARLLAAVPEAQLLVVCPEGGVRERMRAVFASHGVDWARVELTEPCPWTDYIRLFARADLALDTFPCNGMTTACHALWMGLPVVTRMGSSAVGRSTMSVLQTVGLPELAGQSDEDYIRIAEGWARDPARLAEVRRTLRSRMQASPLMDAPRFARNVEAAYRTMWRQWCALES